MSSEAYYYENGVNKDDINKTDGETPERNEVQPARCNDVPFAILFIAHLGAIIWTAAKYVPLMEESLINQYVGNADDDNARRLDENDNHQESDYIGDFEIDVGDVMFLVSVVGCFGLVLNGLALPIMVGCARGLIYFCLVFNIMVAFVIGVSGAFMKMPTLAVVGFIMLFFSGYYAWVVWGRVPFAAANLTTAVHSVRSNAFGLSLFAYLSLIVLFVWTILWSLATISGMYANMGCQGQQCQNRPSGWLIFLFLLSYYWTHQVVKNHLHVTTAGVVGTWWFSPHEANSCCAKAVRDSWFRATTFAFGSICLGSLIVAIVQSLREFLNMIRQNGDDVLLCCAECILSCIEFLIEYFNQWAFVFVGLYGYTFVEAGKNVMNLFKYRGWTTIITDTIADSVLTMMSIGIGLLCGLLSGIIAQSKDMQFGNIAPWIIGFFIGFVLASTMMSIVASAINTVIVCYAEAPNDFQANHPELSDRMRETWRQAWPVEFKY